jgi:hypothetical protein
MTNLLSETVAEIGGSGHTVTDVAWVGSYDGEYALSWAEFEPIAGATQFDSGYGGAEIAPDLVVVFTDGEWLERGEYDGSEWWAHKRQPKRGEGKPFPQAKIIDYEYSLAGIVSKCESAGKDG